VTQPCIFKNMHVMSYVSLPHANEVKPTYHPNHVVYPGSCHPTRLHTSLAIFSTLIISSCLLLLFWFYLNFFLIACGSQCCLHVRCFALLVAEQLDNATISAHTPLITAISPAPPATPAPTLADDVHPGKSSFKIQKCFYTHQSLSCNLVACVLFFSFSFNFFTFLHFQ
jgi:hypothetical protein